MVEDLIGFLRIQEIKSEVKAASLRGDQPRLLDPARAIHQLYRHGMIETPVLGREGMIMSGARKPKKPDRDEDREERIEMEIVVDAHDHEDRAMGWFCYLVDMLHFPFLTRCISERPISPLRVGDEVEVVGMAPEDECEKEMFVEMQQQKRSLAVPLSQLEVIRGDEATKQAVEDWHYWVGMGYEF